jgi:hypothetical protein
VVGKVLASIRAEETTLMTDPSHYQTTHDTRGQRRGVPRSVWIAGAVVVLVALVVVVVLLTGGGHDPSKFSH